MKPDHPVLDYPLALLQSAAPVNLYLPLKNKDNNLHAFKLLWGLHDVSHVKRLTSAWYTGSAIKGNFVIN